MDNLVLNPWIYKATYISNYDGDTIRFLRDCGCNVFHTVTVRLWGIDTPELRSKDIIEKEKAYEARDVVKKILTEANCIYIETIKGKKGKYGRYIANIWYAEKKLGELFCLNEELVNRGLAVYREY